MDFYKEEDFYKDNGSPTEILQYCSYIFYVDSVTEWGRDYDQFALVVNAEYPYIRLTKKRGNCHFPCGGSSQMPTDGSFASKSDAEREDECPKIAWGLAAIFLSNLRYDDNQQDYVLLQDSSVLCKSYYSKYLNRYLSSHNGLKFSNISVEQKELDFIEQHLPLIDSFWKQSSPLKKYSTLYSYASVFEEQYVSFVKQRELELRNIDMPRNNCFSTEIREPFVNRPCIKVFFLDDSKAPDAKIVVEALQCVKNVNMTGSQSKDHPGQNLTVYPKSMVNAKDCEKTIVDALTKFFSNEVVGDMNAHNEAYFAGIEKKILDALDKANATIDVCVAWFTNTALRDKLLEKKNDGVEVRVIIYKDGVNHSKGVDLTGLRNKEYRGERGGIMHEKFCVIDNVTTISGSYNWTLNAENKNDEDASFHIEDYKFASKFTKRFNEMWKRDGNEE